MDGEEARTFEPKIVMVDQNNRIKTLRAEIPGPQMPPRIEA
jgi:aspartate 1-decarboxylase